MKQPAQLSDLKERPFFFLNGDHRLFGVMHKPEGKTVKGLAVLCHPYGEEKLWAQRIYVNFARELAKEGYAVLRFDMMGHGDSEGHFQDSNIETHLSDINCAIATVKSEHPQCENIVLIGLRLGATLAAMIAEDCPQKINHLVLWDPLVDINKFMQMTLRTNLAAQMAAYKEIIVNREQMIEQMKNGEPMNLEGYDLSYDYYQQACAINLIKSEKSYDGRCLIMQIGKEGQPINKQLEKLESLYQNAETLHVVEEPFWKEIKTFCERAENLSTTTLKWLESGDE